jgi:hypothetical protein
MGKTYIPWYGYLFGILILSEPIIYSIGILVAPPGVAQTIIILLAPAFYFIVYKSGIFGIWSEILVFLNKKLVMR